MSGSMLSRIPQWRHKKKSSHGAGGYEKPLDPNHVNRSRQPELLFSRLDGWQPVDAIHNSDASTETILTHDHVPLFEVVGSANELLGGSKSLSKDAEWYEIDSREKIPLPKMEKPESIGYSSVSGLSEIDCEEPEQKLSSNHDALPHCFGESDGIHFPSFSIGPNGNSFPVPPKALSSDRHIDVISTSPPNGNRLNDKLYELNKDVLLNSNRSNYSEPILQSSRTSQMTQSSDVESNTQTPDIPTDILDHRDCILERQVQQATLGGIPKQAQTNSDNQDHQPASRTISSHQLSIFKPRERQESTLAIQNDTGLSTYSLNYPEPATEQKHLEAISHAIKYGESHFITPNISEIVSQRQSQSESPSTERSGTGVVLEGIKHLESSARASDFSGSLKSISNTQSRSESIESHRTGEGRDLRPPDRHEAKLHRLRWRSLKTRTLVSEKRNRLHQVRNDMNDTEVEFVNFSRQIWLGGRPDDLGLKASFDKLQATRNAYGSLEEEYDRLEERLDREEFELAEMEEMMLQNGASTSEDQATNEESQSTSHYESDSETLKGMKAMKGQQNPLYEKFVSRLGDSSLHREAYWDLLFEYKSLLEAKERSQRHGREIPIDDQITLDKFAAREQRMLDVQREIDTDVARLRLECIRMGLLPKEAGEESDILQTSNGLVDPEKAEYAKFSQLLDLPGMDEDEKRSKELLSEFNSGDTGDRITRWLLHKLRSSCSEVELLSRFTDGLDRPVDIQKWQEEVLYFWFMDSAMLPPSAYELDPTVTAVPSSNVTDPEKVEHKPFGEKHYIELVVRSSSMSSALEFGMLLKITRMRGRSAVSG